MSRRAILLAFPLLTAGIFVGAALLLHNEDLASLGTAKILSALTLWLVFAIVVYLRYASRARGRQVAVLTILAFGLLLVSLLAVHPFAAGGTP
jgi:ABC-type uncharacterized transport system permease subunit